MKSLKSKIEGLRRMGRLIEGLGLYDNPNQEKASRDGYVDLSHVPRNSVREWSRGALNDLSFALVNILDKSPTAFIKDPNGVLEASGISLKRLGDSVIHEFLGSWDIISHEAYRHHEESEGEGYARAIDLGKRAIVDFRKVTGKTSPGWRVEMKPGSADILTQAFKGLGPIPEDAEAFLRGLIVEALKPNVATEIIAAALGLRGKELDLGPSEAKVANVLDDFLSSQDLVGQWVEGPGNWDGNIDINDTDSTSIGGEAEWETGQRHTGFGYDPQTGRPVSADWEAGITYPSEIGWTASTTIDVRTLAEIISKISGVPEGLKERDFSVKLAKAIADNWDSLSPILTQAIVADLTSPKVQHEFFSDIIHDQLDDAIEVDGDPVENPFRALDWSIKSCKVSSKKAKQISDSVEVELEFEVSVGAKDNGDGELDIERYEQQQRDAYY